MVAWPDILILLPGGGAASVSPSMSLKRYLTTMAVGTAIAASSWVMVLLFLDPQSTGFIGLVLFFSSFFLMIFGLASIVGFVVRWIFQRRETSFRLVSISFRQAILAGLLLTGSLWLQSQQLFTWWTAAALVMFLSLVEAFFVARAESRQSRNGGHRGT